MFRCSRTAAILTAFATAVCFVSAGCGDEAEEKVSDTESTAENTEALAEEELPEDQQLADSNGEFYHLHRNRDGSETATYPDGREVTFCRNPDNSLSVISGAAGLLGAMAAGYYLAHGFSGGAAGNFGSYDSNTRKYVPSQTLTRVPKKEKEDKQGGTAAGSAGRSSAKKSSSSSVQKNGKSTAKSKSAKSGFGKAGARSGTS